MRKRVLGICFILTSTLTSLGQDVVFSQYYANKLLLNPAFVGTKNCPRLSLSYRREWPGISDTYITYSASYDQRLKGTPSSIGINIVNDQSQTGIWRNIYASGIYGYAVQINRHVSINAGMQGTFIQKNVNTGNLLYGDMLDAREGQIYTTQDIIVSASKYIFDASAGAVLYGKSFYVSGAVFHLTEPDQSFVSNSSPLYRRYTAAAGYTLKGGFRHPHFKWSPNVLYTMQGPFMQLNIGNYFTFNSFTVGAWTRLNDSFIASIGLQTDEWSVGYSYDFTLSNIRRYSMGAHEISFSYHFACKPKPVRFNTISCPAF